MASPRRLTLAALALCCATWAPLVGAADGGLALGSTRVDRAVSGDLVVVGGDLTVGRDGHVGGHAVALLGTVWLEEGARVDGRVVAVRSLASLTLDPRLEGQTAWMSVGLRLQTSGLWLLATTALAWAAPRWLRSAKGMLAGQSVRLLVLGGAAVLTFFAAMVAVVGLGPTLGVPLSLTLLAVFLVAKAAGLAVIGGAVGARVRRTLLHRSLPLSADVLVGTVLILVVRFLPVVGGMVWTVVSVAACGVGIMALVVAAEGGALVLRPARAGDRGLPG